jgi:hypothetical protein
MVEPPALSTLDDELTYAPKSGVLRWKTGKQGRPADLVAGYIDDKGYRRIHISGQTYQAHRIAFAMFHRRNAKGEVDHIDGDRSNNAISNLREATRLENSRNRICAGVQHDTRRKKNPYIARIKTENGHVHLGVFPTESAAHEAYVSATKKHFGEFSSFERN